MSGFKMVAHRWGVGGVLPAALCLGLVSTVWAASNPEQAAADPGLYICLSNSCSGQAQAASPGSTSAGGRLNPAAPSPTRPAPAPGGNAMTGSTSADNYMNWPGSAEDLLKAWAASNNPQLTRLVEPMVPGTARFVPSDDGAQVLTYELEGGGAKMITRGGASNPPGYTQVRTRRPAPLP